MNQLSNKISASEMEEFVVLSPKVALHHLSGWFVCYQHDEEAPLVLKSSKMKEHCKKIHGLNEWEEMEPSVFNEKYRIPGVPTVDGFKCKTCGVTSGIIEVLTE